MSEKKKFTLSDFGAIQSGINMNHEFNILGKNTRIITRESVSYPPIKDDLVEKEIKRPVEEEEEEGSWWGNLLKGVAVVAAVAVVATVAVVAAPAAIAGAVTAVAVGAVAGAAITVAAIQIEDAITGKARSWESAFEDIMFGTLKGAITGATFYVMGPANVVEFFNAGFISGVLGENAEQVLRGEGFDRGAVLEAGLWNGVLCGAFYIGGSILEKLAPKAKQALTVLKNDNRGCLNLKWFTKGGKAGSKVKNYTVKKGPKIKGNSGGKGARGADFYVGQNGKALPAKYKNWIGENQFSKLYNEAQNSKLKNAIKQLYRKESFIGDGGTAAVINFERTTGINLGRNGNSHMQKGIDMLKYLKNKVLTEDLNKIDLELANKLIKDLESTIR